MRERALVAAVLAARTVAARIRDIVTGASGLAAYEHYLSHLQMHHPDTRPMSREAFFRAEVAARWEGVRRCC